MSGPAPRLLNTLLLSLLPIAEAGATQFLISVDPATGDQSLFVSTGVVQGATPAPPEMEGAAYALGALQVINATGSSMSGAVIDNLADILTQTDNAVLDALLRNKNAVDQENQALRDQLRNQTSSPSGARPGPSTPPPDGINDAINQALQQAIATGRIDQDTINAIIERAQTDSTDSIDTGRPSLPPASEREAEHERQRRLAEQRRKQQQEQKEQRRQEVNDNFQQVLNRIEQARDEQQQQNQQAQQRKNEEAEQRFKDSLTQEQRERLAAREREREQQRQQQPGSGSGDQGADRPDGGISPIASAPNGSPGDTGSVASGSAMDDVGGELANGQLDASLAAVLRALSEIGDFNPEDFNTMESFAEHISASYGLDISTFLSGDGQDGELDSNRLIAALTQPGLEDVNTDFANESTRQDAVTEAAKDAAHEVAGAYTWADFTFYNGEHYFPGILESTRALNGGETATYTGLVRGESGSTAATGTITMDFTFSNGVMTGQIEFDNGVGQLDLAGEACNGGICGGATGAAFGGEANGTLDGRFYGPNAEEVGGSWAVEVIGGNVEYANGEFAAKQ